MRIRRVIARTFRTACFTSQGIVVSAAFLLILCFPCVSGAQILDTTGGSFGLVVTHSEQELIPGFTGGPISSWFSGEIAINASILPEDPYNENKTNFSPMGLYILGGTYVLGSLFHEGEGGGTFLNILGYIVAVPVVVMNSRIHFWFHGDPRPVAENSMRASLFVVTRTDVFTSHGDEWWRYSPAIGVEIDFALSRPTFKPFGKDSSGVDVSASSMAIDFGVEKPFDFVQDRTISNQLRFFAGVRFYFERITQIRVKE